MKRLAIIACLLSLWLSVSSFAVESDKIFKIFTNGGTDEYCATAFFISATRVITAAHTFEHHTTKHFLLKNGVLVPMRLIKLDKHADIAVLESDEKNATFYEFSNTMPVKGEQINAIGFCHNERFLTDLTETVKSVGSKIDCKPDGVDGMSGCPLVNANGQVVGMLVSGWGGTSHSVPTSTLKAFIDK